MLLLPSLTVAAVSAGCMMSKKHNLRGAGKLWSCMSRPKLRLGLYPYLGAIASNLEAMVSNLIAVDTVHQKDAYLIVHVLILVALAALPTRKAPIRNLGSSRHSTPQLLSHIWSGATSGFSWFPAEGKRSRRSPLGANH